MRRTIQAPQKLKDAAHDARELTEIKAQGLFKLLKTRTPAQVETYIENNVNNLADAKTVLKLLAMAIVVMLRRGD